MCIIVYLMKNYENPQIRLSGSVDRLTCFITRVLFLMQFYYKSMRLLYSRLLSIDASV
jgi:hypothetical protein